MRDYLAKMLPPIGFSTCPRDIENGRSEQISHSIGRSMFFYISAFAITMMFVSIGFLEFGESNRHSSLAAVPHTGRSDCHNPSVRYEWRSLSSRSKVAYLEAVKCLTKRPSKLRENGTLYDDIPWVHAQVAGTSKCAAHFSCVFLLYYIFYFFKKGLMEKSLTTNLLAHHTPAFLSWHRYFLHIYERALREECGYSGHLAYDPFSFQASLRFFEYIGR